jgi:hypothetical protein
MVVFLKAGLKTVLNRTVWRVIENSYLLRFTIKRAKRYVDTCLQIIRSNERLEEIGGNWRRLEEIGGDWRALLIAIRRAIHQTVNGLDIC